MGVSYICSCQCVNGYLHCLRVVHVLLPSAESAEFATSRDEIEEDYRRRLRDYKKRHSRSKQAGDTASVEGADSVAKIKRQPTGNSDMAMSVKDDVEGQVSGEICPACFGWQGTVFFVVISLCNGGRCQYVKARKASPGFSVCCTSSLAWYTALYSMPAAASQPCTLSAGR